MNLRASLLFAKRILFPKSGRPSVARKSLGGAVLCVGISLIPLVAVLSVSNGMIDGMTKRIVSLSSSHLAAFYSKKDAASLSAAAQKALDIPEISAAYPMLEASALAVYKSKRLGILIRALPPQVFESLESWRELLEADDGGIEEFLKKKNSVMIGKGVSEKLGAKAGDKIRVVSVKKNASGKIAPSVHFYNVAAVVSCGYRELDALWLFMPFAEGERILKGADFSASVMCELDNPFSPKIHFVQKKLAKALGMGFKTFRWDQLNKSQYENFSSTKILLLFIQLLIVLVAVVNISSALMMLALERRREIAILKSLGASAGGVEFSFLAAGFACGAAGLLIGIPLGLLVSANINELVQLAEKSVNFLARGLYFFANNDIMGFEQIHLLDEEYYLKAIPFDVPFGELFFMGAATLLLSLAASFFPAAKAGRERPLDTLRDSR